MRNRPHLPALAAVLAASILGFTAAPAAAHGTCVATATPPVENGTILDPGYLYASATYTCSEQHSLWGYDYPVYRIEQVCLETKLPWESVWRTDTCQEGSSHNAEYFQGTDGYVMGGWCRVLGSSWQTRVRGSMRNGLTGQPMEHEAEAVSAPTMSTQARVC